MQEKIKLLISEETLPNFASWFFDNLKEVDSDLHSLLSKQGPKFFIQPGSHEAKGKLLGLIRDVVIAFLEEMQGDEASSFTFDQKLRLTMLFKLEEQKREGIGEKAIAALTSLQDECKQTNSPLLKKIKDYLELNRTMYRHEEKFFDRSIFEMLLSSDLDALLFIPILTCREEQAIAAGLLAPEEA